MNKQAFPLDWPVGWKRTPDWQKAHARFGNSRKSGYASRELSVAQAVDRVLDELSKLRIRADDVVISTNVKPTLSGTPRSGSAEPSDSGVAVYWRRGKEARCIAVDKYRRVADNLAAIAATLDAMRAIDRHGGAEILDRAFTGFTALPSPEQPFQILGVSADASMEEIKDAHRRLAMKHHPDRGGSNEEMARINAAYEAMVENLERRS